MKIVLGVGNPGVRYENTRHNVGFAVLDELAGRTGQASYRRRFDAFVVDVALAGERVLLVKPQTYVNESGRALRQAVDWYDAERQDVLVVVDDFNLPIGRLRMRRSGSSGGHRGLESVAQHLGSTAYGRLRVGIGSDRRRDSPDSREFVLTPFEIAEREPVREMVVRAADVVELWLREGVECCMNVCNASPRQPESESDQDDKEENV